MAAPAPSSPTYAEAPSSPAPAMADLSLDDVNSDTEEKPSKSAKAKAKASAAAKKARAKPCKIRFKVECEDAYGPSFECEQDDNPFDLKVVEKTVIQQKGATPVIEIVTQLDVATKLPKFKGWGAMGGFGRGPWSTVGGAAGGRKEDDVMSALQGSMFDGRFGEGYPGMFPAAYAQSSSSEETDNAEDDNADNDAKDGDDADSDDDATEDEADKKSKKKDKSSGNTDDKKKKKRKNKKPTLENKRINKVKDTRMIVHSPWLLAVLREVVRVYPSQSMLGETITIREPYHVLAHHITELRDYHNRLALEKGGLSLDADIVDEAAIKWDHLKVLLDYLEPHIERTVLPAHRRLRKETPTTNFADIWYLLRPGALAYAKYDDTWLGCVIETVSFDENGGDVNGQKWTARVWLLDHSWNDARVCRATCEIEIEKFDGEKEVTELTVHPREYHDRVDGGVQRRQFEARGRRAAEMVWQGFAFQNYDGRAMTDKKTVVKGQVIIETQEPWWATREDGKWSSFNWSWRNLDEAVVYRNSHAQTGSTAAAIGYTNPDHVTLKKLKFEPPQDKRDSLTEEHYFLINPVLMGFCLAAKTWHPLNVEYCTPVPKPAFTPDANIAEENLNIIKALSYRQTKSKLSWSADFIKNKGDGVVALLHGPPGVGKTYTVETTAIHTQRPLVSLTIGDLGSNESSIEEELSRWFGLATRWRAVLLIDEADIFLEKRRTSDLARNGVVTAFLRKMEYFGGLLFLTTNRIDSMDEAFMSRVHVVMGFEKLGDNTRTSIWRSFFKKLRDEMKEITVSEEAEAYVLNDPEIVGMDWNGREIRNAFQTAIALAEYEVSEREGYDEEKDGVVVNAAHFKRVMEISRNFKSYVEKTKKDKEEAAGKKREKKDEEDGSDTNSEWADFRDE